MSTPNLKAGENPTAVAAAEEMAMPTLFDVDAIESGKGGAA